MTCTKQILTGRSDRIRATAGLATNFVERVRGRWGLIHHRASHIFAPTSPPLDTMIV